MTGRKPYDLSTAEHDYPLWAGAPRRSILICTLPRSGSTLLGEALYFAGGLGCPLEYFHVGFRPAFEARWDAPTLETLRAAVWRHRTDPSGSLAIKLMWRDVQELAIETDPALFAPLVDEPPERVPVAVYRAAAALLDALAPNATCVHLFRRDRLRQAVSASVARETGQWRAVSGAEMERVREPVYDPVEIDHQISYADCCNRHWTNLLSARDEAPIAMAYEDLVEDYAASVEALLGRLDHDGKAPPTRMKRQSSAQSEAFVLRYLMDRAQRERAPVRA